jgi:type IV pilus assembly protein PilB
MQCKDDWLLRVLVNLGVIDERAAAGVRESGAAYASRELIRRGAASKEQIASAVRRRYQISFSEPNMDAIEKMAFSLVPESLCREHLLVAMHAEGENIDLLMANPLDEDAIGAVTALTGRKPRPFYGLPERIEHLIDEGYNNDSMIGDILKKLPDEEVESVEDVAETSAAVVKASDIGAPVIRLINLIIAQAVRMKASDIHVEHDEKVTMVRYRIDGALRNIMKIPKQIGDGPMVSRIKIMSNLDVADRRRPQDGRAKLRIGRTEIGLRVSSMPTSFGEKVVIRILDENQAQVSLDSMGFRPEILARMHRLSQMSQGIFLLTGPTGSGKTSTLYALLQGIKSEDINIVTVEDPIEYRLEGINQIQVNDKAGMNFASVLRSVLRQDPDVILIGEIRDRETADIAFQAAMTGHMVFSTLHTNDAVSTIARLVDMGVERYKIAPALMGIASQRLVRRICAHCKEPVEPSPELGVLLRREGFPARQFKGAGCVKCNFTGLSGRMAVIEFLDLSDQKARNLLNSGSDDVRFREAAVANGWLMTLESDALWHLSNGDAPLEEVIPFLGPSAAPASAPVPAAATAPSAARPAADAAAPRRILSVDDVQSNRELIQLALRNEGYEITEASSGADALKEIARSRPHLVLLDLMMPEMDGFAVVKCLRGEMGMPDLPVMVLTAMNESESQATALELGADDYLIKPFNAKVLKARVKALFRRYEYSPAAARPGP